MQKISISCAFGFVFGMGLHMAHATAPAQSCFAACEQGNLSEDDRATCQIQCENAQTATTVPSTSPGTSVNPSSAADIARTKAICANQCANHPTPSDQATCQAMCEQSAAKTAATPTTTSLAGASTPSILSPTTANSQPANPQAVAECFHSCNQQKLSPTDLETCRLTCSLVEQIEQETSIQYVETGGQNPSYEQTRQQVIRSSPGVSSSPSPSINTCLPNWQRCNLQCSVPLATCQHECEIAKMSKTDRETCQLTCSVAVTSCQDDCDLQKANCEQQPRSSTIVVTPAVPN